MSFQFFAYILGNLETFSLDWLLSRICVETIVETFWKLYGIQGNLIFMVSSFLYIGMETWKL